MRTTAIGAALALLMTGTAFAQNPPPLESPGQTAPPPPALSGEAPPPGQAELPAPGEAPMPPGSGDRGPGGERADRDPDRGERWGARAGEDRREARRHYRHMMRDHHGADRGMRGMPERRGREGASFRFRSGDDGPSFAIRCAARDTTEQCVEAIMPMLDRVLPALED